MALTRPSGASTAALSLANLVSSISSATSQAFGYRKERLVDPIRNNRWRSTSNVEQVITGVLSSISLSNQLFALINSTLVTPASSVAAAQALAAVWLPADGFTLADGAEATPWTNIGTLGGSFTQTTSANCPLVKTNIIDGKRVVRFDGSNDFMRYASAISLGTTQTIVGVLKFSATSGVQYFFVDSTGNFYFAYVSGIGLAYSAGAGNVASVAWTPSTSTVYLVSMERNGTSVKFFVNGTQQGTTQTLASNTAFSFQYLGGSSTGTNCFAGDLASILALTGASSVATATRLAIQDYLSAKWAATTVLGSLKLELADDSGFTTNPRRWVIQSYTQGKPKVLVFYLSTPENGGTAVAPLYFRITLPAGGTALAYHEVGNFWLGTYRELRIASADNETDDASDESAAADNTPYSETLPRRKIVPAEVIGMLTDDANDLDAALFDQGSAPLIYDQHANVLFSDAVHAGGSYYGKLDVRRGPRWRKAGPEDNSVSFTVLENPST